MCFLVGQDNILYKGTIMEAALLEAMHTGDWAAYFALKEKLNG
jgi:hypothetical protein